MGMRANERDTMRWKENWDETRRHFADWWEHRGLVVGMWGAPARPGNPHDDAESLPPPESLRAMFENGTVRARRNHCALARQCFPADILPVSETDIGPGSLALYLGSEPGFAEDTVWFGPTIHDCEVPETLPPFRFDPSNAWWEVTETTLKESVRLANGEYLVGCPDLVENIDVLASLREAQTLLMDMLERPDWVHQKIAELNTVWFEVYQRIYEIIKLEDGSSAFGPFRIWGPGKTAKLQCDTSAMFSPDMFREFVVPGLREQCRWLDHSLYHLDGTQAMGHLDALLEIEDLDAIEWTPQAGIEEGGHPRWHGLYRKILDAGKSVQVVNVRHNEILPLLDAIGGKGVYVMTSFASEREADDILGLVKGWR